MQTNHTKKLERIFTAFTSLGPISRKVLKFGLAFFAVLLVTGLMLMLLNSAVLSFSSYMNLVAESLVKVSFSVAAEVVIGALILDYVFKK